MPISATASSPPPAFLPPLGPSSDVTLQAVRKARDTSELAQLSADTDRAKRAKPAGASVDVVA